jgi:uncharacterized protein
MDFLIDLIATGDSPVWAVIAGAFAGALASGFAGFAFGAASLSIWAHTISPLVLAQMVVLCSLIGQLLTLPGIWRSIDYRAALPFIGFGLIGSPIGAGILHILDPYWFRKIAGALLIAYVVSVFIAGRLPRLHHAPRWSMYLVGFGGGVMGGFAGLSGILPTIWCSMMKWSKDRQRATFQIFNISMHVMTLCVYSLQSKMHSDLVGPMVLAVPVMLAGSYLGFFLYRRVDETQFKNGLLIFLAISGAGLLLN